MFFVEFDMWELAVLKGDQIHYDNEVANGDVRGWLYDNEVNDLLAEMEMNNYDYLLSSYVF